MLRIELVFLDNGTCTKARAQDGDENDPAHTRLPALLQAVGLFYLISVFGAGRKTTKAANPR
jgi:hypothetical protein